MAKNITDPPKYMFIGCSDNILGAETIFNAQIGTVTSHNNIANQFTGKDVNLDAAVANAVHEGVQHIIVMGHYGCNGVYEAVFTKHYPYKLLRIWLKPVKKLFHKSKRGEIKKLRRLLRHKKSFTVHPNDVSLNALVEENVKMSVKRLKMESVLSRIYLENEDNKVEVFVHGFVYSAESGEVKDLGVSFGPPGKKIPTVPFDDVGEAERSLLRGNWNHNAKTDDATSSSAFTSSPTPAFTPVMIA